MTYQIGQKVLLNIKEIGTIVAPENPKFPNTESDVWVMSPSRGYASRYSITNVQSLDTAPGTAGKTPNQLENDLTLLRPFDLEAAKRGEELLNKCGMGDKRYYVDGLDSNKMIWAKGVNNGLYLTPVSELRMAPLAWVEGRPVYKGAVLYTKGTGVGYKIVGLSPNGQIFIIENGGRLAIDACTWTKPKQKHEGWINIYARLNGGLRYASKQAAEQAAKPGVITTIKITWEE